MLNAGAFTWNNYYGAEVHSPAAVATGVFMTCLSFLPPTAAVDWVARKLTLRKEKDHIVHGK